MAVNDQIIERIRKLLALAGNNPNEHEAAAAAAKAQALMQEHDLEMSAVEGLHMDARTAGVTKVDGVTLHKAGKPGGWKVDLFETVAKTSDCWVYVRRSHGKWYDATGQMVGRKQDLEMAEYVFGFLVRELERLQDEFGKTRWQEVKDLAREWGTTTHEVETYLKNQGRHPLKAKNSWIIGASEAVQSNLWKAKQERDNVSPEANALIVNKAEAIRDFFAQERGYANYAAYEAAIKAKYAPTAPTEQGKVKRLTKREMDRLVRAAEREQRKRDNAERRRWAALDHGAYYAGQDAGRQIGVRPGVKEAN